MDIQFCSQTKLRDQMAEMVLEASRGDVFLVTNHNVKTGAALAPEALVAEAMALAAGGVEEAARRVSDLDEVELRIFLWALNGATARRVLEILDRRREFVLAQSPTLFDEVERKDDATTDA